MPAVVILSIVVGAGAVIIGIIRLRNMKSWGQHNTAHEVSVHKKTVLITGATSGLGKEVAYQMLRRGAIVVIPARTLDRALEAVADLMKKPGALNGTMVPMEMDLCSLQSVRNFAEAFKAQFNRLDILINNAGVFTWSDKDKVTKDGFEYNLGVNYISHFLLTDLLLDTCKAAGKGGGCRIVNVSSSLHEKGQLRLDDLNLRKLTAEEVRTVKPYNNSKLAQVYFSEELARRLSNTNAGGVHTYCLCPGWVYTNLARDVGVKWYQYALVLPVAAVFMRTPVQGSQTILHCALSKQCETETGKLYRNCGVWSSKACPIPESDAKLLWDKTTEMIGSVKTS